LPAARSNPSTRRNWRRRTEILVPGGPLIQQPQSIGGALTINLLVTMTLRSSQKGVSENGLRSSESEHKRLPAHPRRPIELRKGGPARGAPGACDLKN
jgi:hypothetical protein